MSFTVYFNTTTDKVTGYADDGLSISGAAGSGEDRIEVTDEEWKGVKGYKCVGSPRVYTKEDYFTIESDQDDSGPIDGIVDCKGDRVEKHTITVKKKLGSDDSVDTDDDTTVFFMVAMDGIGLDINVATATCTAGVAAFEVMPNAVGSGVAIIEVGDNASPQVLEDNQSMKLQFTP